MEDRYTVQDAQRISSMKPLMTIHVKLQFIVGVMGEHEYLPGKPNWLAELQDLLEDSSIPINHFADASKRGHEHNWPTFGVQRNRLRVISFGMNRRATIENLLELIKKAKAEPPLL